MHNHDDANTSTTLRSRSTNSVDEKSMAVDRIQLSMKPFQYIIIAFPAHVSSRITQVCPGCRSDEETHHLTDSLSVAWTRETRLHNHVSMRPYSSSYPMFPTMRNPCIKLKHNLCMILTRRNIAYVDCSCLHVR